MTLISSAACVEPRRQRPAACAMSSPPVSTRIYENIGYFIVSYNDGLNQMRAAVCLSVVTSPYINCKSIPSTDRPHSDPTVAANPLPIGGGGADPCPGLRAPRRDPPHRHVVLCNSAKRLAGEASIREKGRATGNAIGY
ncbi:hypothetical protein GUJ93_ZPchr0006g42494 [Zizania palustris]|uniref:Uncharacterized protein n=1 Tax=Zizania palustris TaxID=103762 RepID=A0A8J5W3P8_ZIZPA|nr:hypothetical protein GUJ93_ZPchr0006g42494 [Zizania palustris]